MFAVAAAPVPPPPVKLTAGAEVNPEPPFVTETLLTTLVRFAVAAAPVPPPPVRLTVGGVV
jgi:hypothetical protein